jgi:hypothetical protein
MGGATDVSAVGSRIHVRRYEPRDEPGIARFNARLAGGGAMWTVYAEQAHDYADADVITRRLFVAESGSAVRGAVWLHEHDFVVHGSGHRAGWAKYPVSESLVDQAYAGVPGALMIRMQREQPRLMALGMGGHEGAFARLLRSMRWLGIDVPNFVRLVRPARVLRRFRYIRTTASRRLALDALAMSGAGWLLWRAYESGRLLRGVDCRGVSAEVVDRFGDWADALWEKARPAYAFIGRRDARMLNVMMPSAMPVERLRVSRDGRTIGWAVVVLRNRHRDLRDAFGALRVGLIADVLAEPANAEAVVYAADRHLQAAGADLIFSNQLHRAWGVALKSRGYIAAPSQFAFYCSPKMSELMRASAGVGDFHVNRGDCHGPMFT